MYIYLKIQQLTQVLGCTRGNDTLRLVKFIEGRGQANSEQNKEKHLDIHRGATKKKSTMAQKEGWGTNYFNTSCGQSIQTFYTSEL